MSIDITYVVHKFEMSYIHLFVFLFIYKWFLLVCLIFRKINVGGRCPYLIGKVCPKGQLMRFSDKVVYPITNNERILQYLKFLKKKMTYKLKKTNNIYLRQKKNYIYIQKAGFKICII